MLQKPKSHGFELICNIPTFCNDIIIRNLHAYLANGWDGFSILDISNISSPTLLGKLHLSNYADNLTVNKNIVYIGEHPREEKPLDDDMNAPIIYPSGVQFIDVSNPTKPSEVYCYLAPDFVDDVVVHDKHLFILANRYPEPFKCTY